MNPWRNPASLLFALLVCVVATLCLPWRATAFAPAVADQGGGRTKRARSRMRIVLGFAGTVFATAALAQTYVYQSQFGSLGAGNGQFTNPEGVAIDPTSHNIVVVDENNARVEIFDSAGNYLSQFGSPGTGNGQFSDPFGVAIDPTSHHILVTDLVANRVQIFDSAGTYLSQFGSPGIGNGQFASPAGIAIDPTSHNIVVSTTGDNRVQIFDSAGNYLSQFGSFGTGNGQFNGPIDVAVDPTSHHIVVVDQSNARVQIFDSVGSYLSQFGSPGNGNGQFVTPFGVAIDPTSHNVVVVDEGNQRVQIFDSTGAYLSQFGSAGSGNGQFGIPRRTAVDPTSQRIAVTDEGAATSRVQIFAPQAGTAPPVITKNFLSPTIQAGAASQVGLHFTINNPNASGSLTGIGFIDTLPGGLVVNTPNGLVASCSGVTAVPGGTQISMTGGTVGAGLTCTIDVTINAPAGTPPGLKHNVTSAVTSTEGGTGNTASADITVQTTSASPPTIAKSFGAASIAVNGSTSLTFTITNPNASSSLSGINLTDSLPAGLVVSTPNGLVDGCGGVTAVAGSGTISLVDIGLAANASCTYSVNVTGTTPGTKNNTTGVVTSDQGAGGTAFASLIVTSGGPPPPPAPITPIPALQNWALWLLGLLMLVAASVTFRRRRRD